MRKRVRSAIARCRGPQTWKTQRLPKGRSSELTVRFSAISLTGGPSFPDPIPSECGARRGGKDGPPVKEIAEKRTVSSLDLPFGSLCVFHVCGPLHLAIADLTRFLMDSFPRLAHPQLCTS